jgi:hypothetical protein
VKKSLIVSLFIAVSTATFGQKFTIKGVVSDSTHGELALGALVYVKGTDKGVATNPYGFYSITLDKGNYEIICSYIGYKPYHKIVNLNQDISLDIKLIDDNVLNEVVVLAEKDHVTEQVQSTQMGAINIPIEQIKNIPTIGGETDIIKVMQLMPGVKRGDEGQNGMFVRGGSIDGNLILLDEATVYNVSHLFGFFSVFNNDALKDVTLYKGGFPAQFGGRLSSVMDIRMKDGDMHKFHADGGIGLLSSHLTLQGPIIKNKASFLISGRRSYIDRVFKAVFQSDVLPYYFYDVNAKVNFILSDKDRIYLSGYNGDDVLKAKNDQDSGFFQGGFMLGNITATARWNHVYTPKLFSNISLINTKFRYDVEAIIPGNSFLTRSRIADIGLKADYNYYPSTQHNVKFGSFFTNHTFRPNMVNTAGQISDLIRGREGKRIFTQEFGVYLGDDWQIDSTLKLNIGLRYSNLVTEKFLYPALEPRMSLTYNYTKNQSLKFGYTRMKQFLHLVSSSAIALPTDLWYPVTKQIKPLTADQVAASYNFGMPKANTLITIEGYYKWMRNVIGYREGAVLVLNDNYEDELVSGKGWAYGVECFITKTKGALTGWIGYTLSWSLRNFEDLNKGKDFFAKYDRRHDLSIVGSYEFTKRFSISAVWVYATGQRFTPLTGNFMMANSSASGVLTLPIYSDKNAFEMPPAHRFDINFIIKSRPHRGLLKYTGEWHFGAYNLYNRAQPQQVKIVEDGKGSYKYVARGRFGMIPFVAYNFKF